jgi:hypothetical protein
MGEAAIRIFTAPSGACMTPSNETNSDTTILRMIISFVLLPKRH